MAGKGHESDGCQSCARGRACARARPCEPSTALRRPNRFRLSARNRRRRTKQRLLPPPPPLRQWAVAVDDGSFCGSPATTDSCLRGEGQAILLAFICFPRHSCLRTRNDAAESCGDSNDCPCHQSRARPSKSYALPPATRARCGLSCLSMGRQLWPENRRHHDRRARRPRRKRPVLRAAAAAPASSRHRQRPAPQPVARPNSARPQDRPMPPLAPLRASAPQRRRSGQSAALAPRLSSAAA